MNATTPTQAVSDFPAEEYELRARRASIEMSNRGLDALVVTGDWSASCNYRYLSGHWPRDFQMSWSRPHAMVLTASGEAALVSHYATAENARESSWVKDVRESGQPFSHRPLLEALTDLGLSDSTVGWELGTDQRLMMPVAEYTKIKDALPKARFVDAGPVLTRLRSIKSGREVEAMREAAQMNHRAQEYAYSRVRLGSSELDVYQDIMEGLVRNGSHRPPVGQINTNTTAKFRAGLGFRGRLLGPSPEILQPGDLISADCGGNVKGLWVEFDRMACIGKPSPEQIDLHATAREIVHRPIHEVIRPGASFAEVSAAFIQGFKSANRPESDYQKYISPPFMHYCHGLGLHASEYPLVRIDSDDVLEPGMVIAVEGGIIENGMRYHTEETVAITESGIDILTNLDSGIYYNE